MSDFKDHRVGSSRIKTHRGYILVYCPAHPNAKSKGHIYEHRYVVELYLGRYLEKNEFVHHIDGNKSNNNIENLDIVLNGPHVSNHYSDRDERVKEIQKNNLLKNARKRRFKRELVFCECGCGKKLINRDKKGRLRRFVVGHNNRWRK